jgi:hypothetical protein
MQQPQQAKVIAWDTPAQNTARSSRTWTWILSGVFAVNFVLSIPLLFWPYFYNQPHGEEVYSITHYTGLDPRNWWPFDWQGPGLIAYYAALILWPVAAFGIVAPILIQVGHLRALWAELSAVERAVHGGLVAIATIQCLLLLIVCQGLYTYLID